MARSRIFFAGEHTRADFPGTTQGALLSGRKAAYDLLSAPTLTDPCVHLDDPDSDRTPCLTAAQAGAASQAGSRAQGPARA